MKIGMNIFREPTHLHLQRLIADPAIYQVLTRYLAGFNFSYNESKIWGQKHGENLLAGTTGERMTLRRSFAASV